MNARQMHYEFKQRLNKLDSSKNRNLLVPEIDTKLNEAQELFVKIIANPRANKVFGFEKNQRTIDDIRTLVVNQDSEIGTCIIPTVFGSTSYVAALPENYIHMVSGRVKISRGTCSNIEAVLYLKQHDDLAKESKLDNSSFNWRAVNGRFFESGIRMFTDGTFQINALCMDYIRKPRPVYNAQDYVGGQYKNLEGVTLTGFQNCELPDIVHSEIVDLAVLITSGDLELPGYNFKQQKTQITNT